MKTKPITLEELVKLIRRPLDVFVEDGAITELRVPKSNDASQSGLFDDVDRMSETTARLSSKVPGVYFVMNRVKESLRRRVTNRLTTGSSAVKDADVDCRRWLLLDFDPVRPTKSPSTVGEHEDAIAVAKECRENLRTLGWPEPVFADSGNGAHLLYRIDLPNNQKSSDLVRKILLALALWYSTGRVTLDSGNWNASRLTRSYGTMNCKGEQTEERRYRRTRLLVVPEKIQPVSGEMLAQVAGALPVAPTEKAGPRFDVAGWLQENDVQVAFAAPWKDGGQKWILCQCPWNDDHVKSAFIVQFADGGVAAGCLHKSCTGRNWPQLRRMFEGRSAPDSQSNQPLQSGERKQPQTSQLIQLASPNLEPFRTPQGEPYATIRFETHNEHHGVASTPFREYLSRKYFQATRTAPQPTAVSQAVSQFSAVARFGDSTESIFIRIGRAGDRNYLDLADERWAAIEFSSDGWGVVRKPPVKFRRAPGMLALPRPAKGGDLNDLREFLNLRTDDDWLLFAVDLVNAILSTGSYVILGLHGEPGSAKTTASRVFRKFVDPNVSPARGMPKDERDLMVMAVNNSALAFDNLSFLPVWFSDCLCRLSTGGGISRRSLYTDADEFIFDGQRPIVLNGIEEVATRTDLLDRSVLLDLPVIRKFRAEEDFWRQFDAAYSQLLGALLDVAVGVLQNLPQVEVAQPPRMADFTRLGTAAESVLGLSSGAFLRAYNRNRQNVTAVAMEASPIANQIRELGKQSWQGTATELLRRLDDMVGEETRSRRGWPKNPKVLSGMLRRLSPALRTAGGVEIEFDRDETRNRNRMILIRQRTRKAKQS